MEQQIYQDAEAAYANGWTSVEATIEKGLLSGSQVTIFIVVSMVKTLYIR